MTTDTITLRDDGSTAVDNYVSREADLPAIMYDSITETDEHTIKDFLGRMVIIDQGTWSSTQTAGATLANLTFPSALFKTGSTNYNQNVNKLDGFAAMKAKVRVRIEVNSQPFQAGALLLHYVPYSEYMKSHAKWYTNTTTDLVAASGCPHVVMNLANTASMAFVTPYISPYLFYNLPQGQGSFGNVVISVLAPLSSASANSCNYTIWAAFEDVELRYPTDAPLSTVYAQVGKEIQRMEGRGSISGVVRSVGTAVSDVLPWVGLGWLSEPARFLTDAGESVLKMLGFSKPSVEAPVTRVKQSPMQYFLNADGADTSHKLGLSAANALATLPGWAGTDEDEMRLDYICSRPNYYNKFTWTTESTADTSLYIQANSPLWTQSLDALAAGNYAQTVSLPLIAKVASQFGTWRGTMVYTFHVVKTQFHSGRLRVSFRPFSYPAGAAASDVQFVNQPGYAYTDEIDLSSGTTFTFEVPFVSVRPWMHCYYDAKTAYPGGDIRNSATGIVQLSVINPLVAASTVNSSVDILVFVSMKDAQFASPVNSSYLPFGIPNVAQIGRARIVPTKQSSDQMSERSELSMLPYAVCMGENVTSVRQLLKRYSYLGRVSPSVLAATATQMGSSGRGFVIFPWAPVTPQNGAISNTLGVQTPKFISTYKTVSGAATTTIAQYVDTYSQFYPLYAFFRGSMRFKVVVAVKGPNYDASLPINVYIHLTNPASAGNMNPIMSSVVADGAGASSSLGSGPLQCLFDTPIATGAGLTKVGFAYQPELGAYKCAVIPGFEGAIEFEVPFHCTGHMVPTNYGIFDQTSARSIFFPFPIVSIVGSTTSVGVPILSKCEFDVYRAVGDDFSFGGLIGSPQHALWQSTIDPI